MAVACLPGLGLLVVRARPRGLAAIDVEVVPGGLLYRFGPFDLRRDPPDVLELDRDRRIEVDLADLAN